MLRPLASIIFSGVSMAGLAMHAVAAEPQQMAQATAQQPAAAQAKAKAPAVASGEDSALQQRVNQLEEQLVDMQVVIGTLESLARGGGGGGAAPAADGGSFSGGADSVRLDGLETQLRALAAQVQQLTEQVRSLGGQPRRSDLPPAFEPANGQAPTKSAELSASPPAAAPAADHADTGRFGSTTVTAGSGGDSIGGLIEGDQTGTTAPADAGAPTGAPGAAASPAPEMAALPPAFGAATAPNAEANPAGAKQLYETAYGYLMQRDYTAAQSAFEDFLGRYPQDSLAGNAQYWLGEAHFVRGEYKAAAGSFLKGYQNYTGNPRAADSLLKLAMSLDRLGQKDAACSSFGELSSRFPNAPENVKMRAKSERQRIGCT